MARVRWKRFRRRLLWGAGILVGVVVALGLAVGIFLRTHYGKEFVRRQLEQRLSAALDGQVSIGAVDSVRFNRLVIRDLKVTDAQHRPVLTVRAAEIDISPWSLLSHNLRLSRVVLHAPSIVATQAPDGQWNTGQLLQPATGEKPKPGTSSSKPWHIAIASIEIDEAKVALMPRDLEPITLDHLALHASVDWMKDHGTLTLPTLTAHWLQRDLPIQLSATATLPGPGLYQAHEVHFSAGGLGVRASTLTMDRLRDTVEAAVTIDSDAATVRRLLDGHVAHPDAWLADLHLGGRLGHDPLHGWNGALAGQVGTAFVQASGGLSTGPVNVFARTIGLVPRQIWATAPVARIDASLIAHVQGRRVADLVAAATLELQGSAATLRIDQLHASATLDHGAATWTASFATDRGHGHSEGAAELQPLRIDRVHLVARVDGPRELVRLSPLLRGIRGAFDVDVTASGTPSNLSATGTVTGRSVRYQDVRAQLVTLHGHVSGLPGAPVGEVTLGVKQGTRLGKTIGPLIADARFSDHGRRIAVAMTAVGGPTLPYSGHVTAVVLRAPGTTTIQLGTLAVVTRGLAWHAAGGTVVLAPRGRIDVAGVQLVSSAGTVELTGTLDSRRAALTTNKLHIHVIDVDLARVQRALGLARPDLAGVVNLDVHLERAKHQLALDLTGSGRGVTWRRGLPALDADLRAVVANGHFDGSAQVSERKTHGRAALVLAVAAPQDPLNLAGWRQVDRDEIERLQLDLQQMRLETAMLFVTPAQGQIARPTVTGMVSGQAAIATRGAALETHLTFSNLASRGTHGIDATVTSRWDQHRLTLAVTSRLAGASFLSGQLTLAQGIPDLPGQQLMATLRTAPASGRFEINQFPLQKLAAVNLVQQPLGGVLDAHLTLAGSLERPTGHFDLRAAKAQFGKVGFSELAASGDGDRRGVKVSFRGKEQQGGSLQATATLPLGRLAPVAITVHAQRFDLSFVQALASSPESALNDVTGRLDADLSITGTRQAPDAKGRVSLRQGRLFVPGANFGELYGVEIDATLSQDRVLLSRFKASSGRGNVSASGSGHLLGVMPDSFLLDIKSDKMLVHAGATLAAVDIDVHAEGHKVETTWEVAARVASGTIYLPRKSPGQLQPTGALDDVVYVDNLGAEARRKALVELANRGHQLPTLRLTLTTGEILVTGPSVHAWSTANLALSLSAEGTSIKGAVRMPRGDVTLFGRRYDLAEARVLFDGAVPPEPQLRIRLTHEFRSMTLSIQITGTPKKPVLKLTADPPNYSDAQLAGFVLGGDPDDASQVEQPSTEQRAADAAAGLIASAVQSQLADALPIDVLRLEVGDGAATGPSIEVGKWLTSDLLLGYRYRTPTSQQNQNSNEVLLEYRFGKRWMLEGSYGNAGTGNADVLWSKRY